MISFQTFLFGGGFTAVSSILIYEEFQSTSNESLNLSKFKLIYVINCCTHNSEEKITYIRTKYLSGTLEI